MKKKGYKSQKSYKSQKGYKIKKVTKVRATLSAVFTPLFKKVTKEKRLQKKKGYKTEFVEKMCFNDESSESQKKVASP